ncbi:glycosyltransferase family 4 protein [Halococcus agarilyticus]|uniref:glycosyltransferase family 4 protein n=1 Tax=Halococcus agarilyticus TaxID=1232219 RepID=UPI0006777F64|nr:glycosyltransferase family 4 protein [Halococcus agarilyticus]
MEIAFVHPEYPRSEGTGAAHSASRIVLELAKRGHDVTVYCTERPPSSEEGDTELPLEFLELSGYPYHSGVRLNQALRSRANEFDAYDLIHSYYSPSTPALAEIGSRTSTATVVTLNAYRGICPKNDLRYLDREPCTSNGVMKCTACSLATSGGHDEYSSAYRTASRLGYLKLVRESGRNADRIDGYHALSPHVKAAYADFGFPRNRIRVIPNMLDETFCREHESDFGEPYELLYVGSLDRHKGVDKLLPILTQLRRRSPREFQLTIVGDGGLRSELEKQARERDLRSAVSFTGQLPNDELPGVYAAHDLFLYPGRWDEPFGRVFLESLAAGTPVVSSDVGSVGDIIGSGGRTTDGTVRDFSRSIIELVENNELPTLSDDAKRTAAEYRAETVVPEFVELYEQVL